MLRAVSLTVVLVAVVLATAGCGADASATFKADGSVTVGMKILFPKSLMQSSGGTSIGGFSQSDIASANKQLQQKYSGGTITVVTEGDESGAVITIPFKTEKDAFAFLTQPPKMSPSSAASGSSVGLNLSNTGGMFSSATHTTSGATDTYRFVTVAQPQASPKSGQQQVITDDELQSIFTITFAITVPHVITSAPGALFTLDRKTAIWKLHWTRSETLTATTGADAGLTAGVLPLQDWRLLIAVAFVAVAGGFLGGMFIAWRGLTPRPAPTPPAPEVPPSAWP